MKNTFLTISFLWVISLAASAQNEAKVLSFTSDETYNKYLVHRMYTQYDQRDSVFYSPLTRTEADAYGKKCKKAYLDILGELPERVPVRGEITKVLDMGHFYMENILYESSPDRHVTATLYRPKAAGKYPAVIIMCGHGLAGKNSLGEQAGGARYTANGMIYMVIDPVSQGERMQIIDNQGNPQARGGTTGHTLLNMNSLIVGESTVKDELWDNIRGLDYLETRPEVDANRLGCFGFSGGGTQSMYVLAYDDRIKVAGVGGFFTQRRRSIELINPADGCQHLPGEGEKRLEEVDFMASFAPKPLVIVGGQYCFVDWFGAEKGFKELQHLYSAYRAKDNVFQYLGDDGHAFPKDKQDVVINWFVKHLCGKNTPAVETPDFTRVPVAEMNVTSRGNLSEFLPEEILVPKRNRMKWDEYASVRAEFAGKSTAEQQQILHEVARIYAPASVRYANHGVIERGKYRIEKISLHADGETPLPCLVYVPNVLNPKPSVIIYAPEEGKANYIKGAEEPEVLCENGDIVVLTDLRGIGETLDRPSRNESKFYNREYANGMIAMHVGESLVAQRTRDLLMILDYLSQEPRFKSSETIAVQATGKCAAPALHASVFDPRISRLKLYSNVSSWSILLDNPTMWDQISYIVPGAGLHYDLTDLREAAKKRGVPIDILPQ